MDDLDLEEMKAIFIEECSENIDILENGLLRMGDGCSDADLLNEVFRAAHSIKGGGATFGFMEMSELTHHMETLLDEMRSLVRPVNDVDVELLLQSVDILRDLIDTNTSQDDELIKSMQSKLVDALGKPSNAGNANVAGKDEQTEVEESTKTEKIWHIEFIPKPEIVKRGNDPALLIRELTLLGKTKVTVDTSKVPSWGMLNPQLCYLSWKIDLEGAVEKESIIEIFEWVELDCTLEIKELKQADKKVESVGHPKDDNKEDAQPAGSNESAKNKTASTESSSIRIATEKVDTLINLVGELVITQSMLNRAGLSDDEVDKEQFQEQLVQLERNTRELQESVMRVRMLPISFAFSRLPRLIRDLSKKLDKKIDLVVEGESTELDKTVLERMMDPFVHLVRNSIDHGIESPDERIAAGKSEAGTLTLRSYHQGSNVVIEIIDDGKGIDSERILDLARERGVIEEDEELSKEQINHLIFAPGFSTAKEVSDVSGRGVGMDVVRRNITDLGGRVTLHSELGEGTKVVIRLPLTLAILDGQLIRVSDQIFVIPILKIVETIEIKNANLHNVIQNGEVCKFRGEYLPLIRLRKSLMLKDDHGEEGLIVIVDVHGKNVGFLIDEVLGQQQVVIKALEENFKAVQGISGATIMSNGKVALILDPQTLAPENILSNAA